MAAEQSPTYDALDALGKSIVEKICAEREARVEFPDELDAPSRLELVACDYRTQLNAFQDVLKGQGYELVKTTSKDYRGRIAALTLNGTLIMLGAPNKEVRAVEITRIHCPELEEHRNRPTIVRTDPTIGESLELSHKSYEPGWWQRVRYSPTRGLAINPRSVASEEPARTADRMRRIVTSMGEQTMRRLLGQETFDST